MSSPSYPIAKAMVLYPAEDISTSFFETISAKLGSSRHSAHFHCNSPESLPPLSVSRIFETRPFATIKLRPLDLLRMVATVRFTSGLNPVSFNCSQSDFFCTTSGPHSADILSYARSTAPSMASSFLSAFALITPISMSCFFCSLARSGVREFTPRTSNALSEAAQIMSRLMLIFAVVRVPVLSEHNTSMEAMSWSADMRVTMAWWRVAIR
mmetsp:Transcript_81939/g.206148  ORF Transcript_81939/g.206148 Transcript_81939/m.206148 type:complete len:211 (+) Transcript_81939:1673-2305(+)